jgi:hypothetical protein
MLVHVWLIGLLICYQLLYSEQIYFTGLQHFTKRTFAFIIFSFPERRLEPLTLSRKGNTSGLYYKNMMIVKDDHTCDCKSYKWNRINCKQVARWQRLSWVKASAFLFEFFLLGVKKYNLYLRLVMPSSG